MQSRPRKIEQSLLTRFRMRQLIAYISVYEHRNIQAAARELELDHSTVSKSLSEMEAILNAPLFTRHTRGVSPTTAGDVLYRHARQIVNQCARTADELSQINAGAARQVVIGCVSYLDTAGARALPAFRARCGPGQTVRLIFNRFKDLDQRLRLGELDLVIARLGMADPGSSLHQLKAYSVTDVVVARADHPCAGKARVSLAELSVYPWVLPPANNPFRSYHEGLFYQEGLALPADVAEIASLFAAREAVCADPRMVAVLPHEYLHEPLDAGTLVRLPVAIPLNPPPVGVAFRADAAMSGHAGELVDALRETLT